MQENPENILVVIPARGGSKGIKLKNLKQLLGVSLVGRAIDCAFEIAKKSNVLLSTDHHLILEEAKKHGLSQQYVRPENLSGDFIGDVDVLLDAIHYMENNSSIDFNTVIMLQPTSPLRRTSDIKNALALYFSKSYDAVWSVSECDSKHHPRKILEISQNNNLQYYHEEGNKIIARQQLTKKYVRNGAFYIININKLIDKKSLLLENTYPFITTNINVSIDTEWDLELCEYIMKNNK